MVDLIESGFSPYTDARVVVEGLDLADRTAIITGAGSGIGAETARALASVGAEVVMAVRRPAEAEALAAEITEAGRGSARVEALDLSDLASVRAFVARWGARPLHLLINNAGVMACPLSRTADGFEMQFGTNHLGHFALAVGLASALERGAKALGRPSRLVALSSIGHRRSGIHFDDPHYRKRAYDKWEAYGQSKTANALFAVGFHARFKDRGITANAVHPGGIMTPLQRHLPREEMIAFGWMDESGKVNDRFKTPAQGASTSVWAATAAALEGIGGLYLEDCRQARPFDPAMPFAGVMDHARDPKAADRLWAISLDSVGLG